ncbi:hypothetical protein S40293_00191 [Stachybotrys chartarum IBT 40293]|nr:hypothetical protein S40293_00191 [Stachybotrys chartarum IBT 40293]
MSFSNETLKVSSRKSTGLLSLWDGLNRIWTPIMGYKAEEFNFIRGQTLFSTHWEVMGMIALYLVVIFGGREFMRDRKPFQLNFLFKLHNFCLSALSAALLALYMEQLLPSLWREGFYNNICSSPGWTPQLVTLYYLNYITKYVELIDTIFLMVRKKPLTFLHTYHHPATALLCYTQLIGSTPVSWVPITLNLAVHVIMYWYYFQSARGVKIWWKEWITRFQITQFIIDLGVVYFASWNGIVHRHWPRIPHVSACGGKTYAAVAGCSILSSYLVLFVMFYIATYQRAAKKTAKASLDKKDMVMAAKNSASSMANEGIDRKLPSMAEK